MRHVLRTVPILALIAILAAILAGCSGSDTEAAPEQRGHWAFLHQQAPGDTPTIRLRLENPSIPVEDQIFAWLFFRSDDRRYFSLTADALVDAVLESRLPRGVWDDAPQARGLREIERDFRWINASGEQETGTIRLEFDDPALRAGVRYYHRVQRVVEPLERAGSGAPLVQSAQVAQIDIDPWDALSEGSQPTQGVTFITPPVLQSPADGASSASTTSITFVWRATAGADEYVVQVFPADDPNGERNPRYQQTLRRDFGGTVSHTFDDNFAAGSRFFWRVGVRNSAEAQPVNELLLQRGWLYSDMRSFTTAQAPPPPPT